MHWKGISKPKGFVCEEATRFYGRYSAEPFERGFGVTIGNSLRRVLLSSLKGWAVSAVKIDGVLHQFSPIPGVVEDATEIILNLKQLRTKLSVVHPKIVYLSAKGPGEVKASDIKPDPDVEILTPDIHIATLDDGAQLNLEIRIEYGRGYVPAEQHDLSDLPEGWIPVDSIFSPVRKVNFRVENVLHLERADYDRLLLEIWTDGSIEPLDAAANASKILKDIFQVFVTFEEPEEEEEEEEEEKVEVNPHLFKSIEELDLGSRPMNCLRAAKIKTVAQLVTRSDQDMLKLENFGKESLREVKKVLSEMDLTLGMDLSGIAELEPYLEPEQEAEAEEAKAEEEVAKPKAKKKAAKAEKPAKAKEEEVKEAKAEEEAAKPKAKKKAAKAEKPAKAKEEEVKEAKAEEEVAKPKAKKKAAKATKAARSKSGSDAEAAKKLADEGAKEGEEDK